jgi:hypothetical protein
MKNSRNLIIIGFGALIVIGALLILAPVLNPPASIPISSSRQATPTELPASDVPYPDVVRVTVGNARAAQVTKQAIFVDVRDQESYARSHIAGALSIPLDVLEERLGELDKEQWIITYCT